MAFLALWIGKAASAVVVFILQLINRTMLGGGYWNMIAPPTSEIYWSKIVL
ncbi:unnamed protein product [Sphenostylis stenocarpa]|uniref:Uncharacterized protein n=1 Tax=Sphenostylis stenocarpa TaxID=92480 RepID=A0AA86TBK0_9FABA|nr:unnamed protein product [Sphenostylis stenocarpa]